MRAALEQPFGRPDPHRLEDRGGLAVDPLDIGDGIGHSSLLAHFQRLSTAARNGSNELTQARNRADDLADRVFAGLFAGIGDDFAW